MSYFLIKHCVCRSPHRLLKIWSDLQDKVENNVPLNILFEISHSPEIPDFIYLTNRESPEIPVNKVKPTEKCPSTHWLFCVEIYVFSNSGCLRSKKFFRGFKYIIGQRKRDSLLLEREGKKLCIVSSTRRFQIWVNPKKEKIIDVINHKN